MRFMKKTHKLTKSAAVYTALFFSNLALAQSSNPILTNNQGRSLGGFVDATVGFINDLVAILMAASLLVFFWGMAMFILKAGDVSEHKKGRDLMFWGVIVFFVMSSIWGIIRVIGESIF